MNVCYLCMYVYFNEWRSDIRVLVRLGLNTLIGWLHAVSMYVCTYVCMYTLMSGGVYVCIT